MKGTRKLLSNSTSPWPIVLVLNALPGDCVRDWHSSEHKIESKAATNRMPPRLTLGSVSLEEKWNKFDLPSLDQFKRNRLPITSVDIEMEHHLSRLNDSTRNIFDSTTPDAPLSEMGDLPIETQDFDQPEPSNDHRRSQNLVKPEESGGDKISETNAAINVGNRFNMPMAREVMPSQDTICEDVDITLGEPSTQRLLDDSDEDMFLELNRTPENNVSNTPPSRNYCSGVTPGPVRLHGSPIARSSPFIPNMMLRSPSIFARLCSDLEAPRLNLQRLRLSSKTLFSQKRVLDDKEEGEPSCASLCGTSNDDDCDDSVIGIRRPGKIRRIADTQNDTIEQNDTSAEKLAREFIYTEAEASDEFEFEEEESDVQDDTFVVSDSQVVQGTPASSERAMYLQSVRDLPRPGAFYFPNRQRQSLAMSSCASPMSVDGRNSQEDTYDQSFLDEDPRAESQLSMLELLEAKLETKKTRKRTISDESE
uniref:Protein aurora borealis n=1 Tax=Anopheles albimanus TaxID=7167 RepID=A0A182FIF3_ANOAL